MKKSVLILILSILGQILMAQSEQPWLEKKISISIQDKAVEAVLKSLENDLDGMAFAYLPGSFDMAKKVTVKLDSVPLRQVLEEIFAEQQMECTEMRGKIFLKKKKQKPQEKSGTTDAVRRKRTVGSRTDTDQAAVKNDSQVEHTNGAKADKNAAGGNAAIESGNASDIGAEELKGARSSGVAPALSGTTQRESVSSLSTAQAIQNKEVDKSALETNSTTAIKSDAPSQVVHQQASVPELLRVQWNGQTSADNGIFGEPYIPPLPLNLTLAEERKPFLSWLKMPAFLTKDPDKPAREKKAGVSVNSDDEIAKRGLRLYLATTVGVSPLGDENGVKIGGRVVWQKSPSLGLGAAGYGIVGSSTPIEGTTERYRIAGGYGGFHMEYTLNPDRPIHLSFPILVALGEVTYVNATDALPIPGITEDGTQVIMVLEPGAMLEMNVFKFMKMGLNVTYRYTTNSEVKFSDDSVILSASDMNGISAAITIKLGRF